MTISKGAIGQGHGMWSPVVTQRGAVGSPQAVPAILQER